MGEFTVVDDLEYARRVKALVKHAWNQRLAAEELGIKQGSLSEWVRRNGLSSTPFFEKRASKERFTHTTYRATARDAKNLLLGLKEDIDDVIKGLDAL